jgi:hypothetical protein
MLVSSSSALGIVTIVSGWRGCPDTGGLDRSIDRGRSLFADRIRIARPDVCIVS